MTTEEGIKLPKDLTSKEAQAAITETLRDAVDKVGREELMKMLPAPFAMWISSHDTGCQINIQLATEGKPAIVAWIGSVWYASRYEFNDRDKVLGLQDDVPFAQAPLQGFFTDVLTLVSKTDADELAAVEANKSAGDTARADALDFYRDAIENPKPAEDLPPAPITPAPVATINSDHENDGA
jgi:hypothetical protein